MFDVEDCEKKLGGGKDHRLFIELERLKQMKKKLRQKEEKREREAESKIQG